MDTIKYIFSSLFSNKKIIDESKTRPWYLAIIIGLLSLIVSAVPFLTSGLSVHGSDILLANENYNIDYSLLQFSKEIYEDDKIKIEIVDQNLVCEGLNEVKEITYDNPSTTEVENKITLLVYYVATDGEVTQARNTLKMRYPASDNPAVSSVYSTLIFTKTSVFLNLYKEGTTVTFANGAITEDVPAENTVSTTGSFEDIEDDYKNIKYFHTSNHKNTWNMWCKFFDQAYAPVGVSSTFLLVGMTLGMNLLIVLIMSLTLFLISRGKRSIRKYNYLEALKMVFFSLLSPAIIALILSYIMPSLMQMGFVMCVVLRITWLGMKATSPEDGPAPTQRTAVRK